MAQLSWDGTGVRVYETGVDHGVLYPMDAAGAYPLGVSWNGLISISESPEGAEPSDLYADNIKYLTLMSAETLKGTIEAYTYPDEWNQCDGSEEAANGVMIGQQSRKKFGLVFRTKVGNDVAGEDLGYKLHLLYGCQASPSERSNASINDSPEAVTLSWEFTTTPVPVTGYKPTASIVIDSRTADAVSLEALLLVLFGGAATDPNLPLPDDIITAMTP